MMVAGTQQVMLKVRFAEMQRSVAKSLASSLAIRGAGGNLNGVGATGNFTANGAVENAFDSTGNTYPIAGDKGAIGLGFTAGNLQFAVLLEALESKGVVRTLAEPNLTALSGQQADFLAGGEYPIPVLKDNSVSIPSAWNWPSPRASWMAT
jgi:pilus assembly protein CpaC